MTLQLASTIAIFISCLDQQLEHVKLTQLPFIPIPPSPTTSNFNLIMRMILQRRRKVDKWESKNCFIFQRPCEDTTQKRHNNE
jgi:hypothetical protein